MGKLTDKVKDTLTGAKDSVIGKEENADNRQSDSDPLNKYESKEPMTPAKIKEHEPTAVKREMTENIAESGQVGTNPQNAAERARRSGMTKGTAGATQTGSDYEQESAGTNQ
ncbi:MAG: hypothetical protein ACRD8W_24635 [Nitrososphaeraceae archaeon]